MLKDLRLLLINSTRSDLRVSNSRLLVNGDLVSRDRDERGLVNFRRVVLGINGTFDDISDSSGRSDFNVVLTGFG